MKTFISILLLSLLSISSFAAPASFMTSNNSLQLGGTGTAPNLTVPSNNPDGYFTVYCGGGAAMSNTIYNCYKNGVKYQVTAGKTFKTSSVTITMYSSVGYIQLITATATFADAAAYGSVTGVVPQGGGNGTHMMGVTTAGVPQTYYLTWEVAGSLWLGIQGNTGGVTMVAVVGKETTP